MSLVNTRTTLYEAVREERWDDALLILQTQPIPYIDEYLAAEESILSTSKPRTKSPSSTPLEKKHHQQWTALHWACCHSSTPLDFITRLLIDCPSDIVSIRDNVGCTPLHYAIWNSGNDDIIRKLISVSPPAVSVANDEGCVPLHWAVRDSSISVIRDLVEADSGCVRVKDRNGSTPLQYFFERWNMRLRDVILVMERDGVSDRRDILDLTVGVEKDGRVTLKEVYDKGCSLLIAAWRCDGNGMDGSFLPLHASLAVSFCPWSFFHILLKLHPEEAWMEDCNFNLPLHIALKSLENQTSSDGDLYKCVICVSNLSTRSWFRRDNGGDERYCQPCFTEYSFREDNYSLVRPVNKTTVAIQNLLSLCPLSASVPHSKNNQLPLQIAIEHSKHWDKGLECVFKTSPRALSVRCTDTHLFPFMTAAVRRDTGTERKCNNRDFPLTQMDTVYELLMEDPNLVGLGVL